MSKINRLSPHVADLIAAGEVVERPGSVVKELVENSIDAGATAVTVEIRNGGVSYIRVTDNGCGMASDDAEIAFLRHATSKLRDERGLEAISTLGFRGEALAAISAVSRINMLTRENTADHGTDISLEGGSVIYKRPAGCPAGTTIIVRDLFFNTPARLKFMKSDRAEGANVSAVVQRIAMSHPEVSIRYIKDGKEEYHTPGDNRIDSCAYSILGREFAAGLLEVTGVDSIVPVHGYITTPVNARGNRNYQFFYVNGRFVKSKTLQSALEQAYRNSLFTGRFPGCILYINVSFAAVDVNVHPTKTEVKFLNEKQVFDAVYYSVLASLEGENRKAEITLSSGTKSVILQRNAADEQRTASGVPSGEKAPAAANYTAHTAQNSEFFKTLSAERYRKLAGGISEQGKKLSLHNSSIPFYQTRMDMGPVAKNEQDSPVESAQPQFPNTVYSFSAETISDASDSKAVSDASAISGIKYEAPYSQVLSGQEIASDPPVAGISTGASSAHQNMSPAITVDEIVPEIEDSTFRIVGEALTTYIIVEQGGSLFLIDKHAAHERMLFDKLKRETGGIMSQQLLTPFILQLDRESAAALMENKEYLEKFGFEIDEFGGSRIALRALPADIREDEIPSLLAELAEKLQSGHRTDPDSIRDEILHSVACRAAIKAGKASSPTELLPIAKAVMSGQVRYCPHGRPVAMELTKSTIDKNFKRI